MSSAELVCGERLPPSFQNLVLALGGVKEPDDTFKCILLLHDQYNRQLFEPASLTVPKKMHNQKLLALPRKLPPHQTSFNQSGGY